ncbi:probable epoxide hydrolase [Rhodococcus jostii RHA1]|uniref:Probable epoxide hydrolase n=1 Tax=Rhodococcus jostii (strain RHA1) TaxID=101510 RepID=Q0SKN3_RHOJR|nr:probable epoxide hydrolase [Rhodococcus jostii RHA1]
MVLLHGFPQHWWEWRGVLPGLAAHYRVICPDLRGAGWTDAPPTGYTSEQLLADVVALLDALELDQVCLIAHDWGALLGYELCLRAPHRVRKYVSLGVPPVRPVRSTAARTGASTPDLPPAAGFHHEPEHLFGERHRAVRRQLRAPARAAAASALYRCGCSSAPKTPSCARSSSADARSAPMTSVSSSSTAPHTSLSTRGRRQCSNARSHSSRRRARITRRRRAPDGRDRCSPNVRARPGRTPRRARCGRRTAIRRPPASVAGSRYRH